MRHWCALSRPPTRRGERPLSRSPALGAGSERFQKTPFPGVRRDCEAPDSGRVWGQCSRERGKDGRREEVTEAPPGPSLGVGVGERVRNLPWRGPERASRAAGCGTGGGVGCLGPPSPAVPSAGNNGETAGEGGTREGRAGVSRKGETKEPSADCHLRVTRPAPPAPSFSSPCSCSCGPRRVHCTHRCGASARRLQAALRGAPPAVHDPTCGYNPGSWGLWRA